MVHEEDATLPPVSRDASARTPVEYYGVPGAEGQDVLETGDASGLPSATESNTVATHAIV